MISKKINMKSLFTEHIQILQTSASRFLEELDVNGLVFSAGVDIYRFEDDMTLTFKANHHFLHWCPLASPQNMIVIEKGKKPLVLAYVPQDYWHQTQSFSGDEFWAEALDLRVCSTPEEIWKYLQDFCAAFHLHGPTQHTALEMGLLPVSIDLLSRLNWQRSLKTNFEIECSVQATALAAIGHAAAKAAFLNGASEFEIYKDYLKALQALEKELPYEAIICLNQNGAILHYHGRNKSERNGNSFLIDAGAQINGFASDISRTYASEKAHPVFKSMLHDLNIAQLNLCEMVKPGLSNLDLHLQSHADVARILMDHDVIQGMSLDAIIENKLTLDFYPHGVGHLLGIHVHDVGGYQMNEKGDKSPLDPRAPKLRSIRKYDTGNYFTIEPGIYFIDILLDKRKTLEFSENYNWKLISELLPMGGIRIEDNLLVSQNGVRNITREYLP